MDLTSRIPTGGRGFWPCLSLAAAWCAAACLCVGCLPGGSSAAELEPPLVGRPLIGPLTLGIFGLEGTTEVAAWIDPQGLETTYRIALDCGADGSFEECNPTQSIEGILPAGYESQEEILNLTGLRPSGEYQFIVKALNAAGKTSQVGGISLALIPPGGSSECVGCDEPYETKESQWAIESGNLAAAETLREQRAKEATEAKVAASKAAEEPADDHQPSHVTNCVVPLVRGDSLDVARSVLGRAHCRLGKVVRPRHYHGRLVVIRESPRRGTHISSRVPVALILDAKDRIAR